MPVTCAFGVLVLLAVLGAAGPGAPVTAVTALPPPDTTAFGATGQLPDPTPVPLPDLPPSSGLPADPGSSVVTGSGLGIPETVLAAYRSAATTVDRTAPGCGLTWPLVAGIGKVESGHASGGAVDADGTTLSPILGPRLTGTGGNAAIADTDRGALDHDAVWDRAVGPTQFIPSSWRTYGADGNGDGRADPDNVFDAGLATARYLCAGGGDLAAADVRHDAVFRYNHSEAYVATVLRWADAYASGALPVPDSTEPTWTGETLADGAPTLAALPEPSTAGGSLPLAPAPGRVPTAGPAPAGPVITTSGATRPGNAATRSPGPDPAGVAPAPARPGSVTTTPSGTTSSTPPVGTTTPGTTPASSTTPPTGTAPAGAPAVGPTTPGTTTPGTTTPGTTTPGTTPPSGAASPSAPSSSAPVSPGAAPSPSAPRPASVVPPAQRPVKPSSSTPRPASSTPPPARPAPAEPSSSTTAISTPTPAARCTAAIPVAARALGVPAAQVTGSSEPGPGAGRTTCTLRGPQGPLLVAVTAAAGAPAPATPAAGVSRAVAGGRTVLTVPSTAGLPADRARTALVTIGAAWS